MSGYLMRRFALMLLTLFGMSILIFLVMRLVPGNIADILVDSAGIIDPNDPRIIYVTLAGYSRKWIPPGSLNDANTNVGEGHVFKSTDAIPPVASLETFSKRRPRSKVRRGPAIQ